MSIPEKENPLELFNLWFEEAKRADIEEPTAFALATANKKGWPSVRMVLLKHAGSDGFVFYTNKESKKGKELAENKKAEMCFYWMPLDKQVRIKGRVEPVSDKEADEYFAGRPRMSQIGAWASRQSAALASRFDLEKRVAYYTKKFLFRKIPRPSFWGGYNLIPEQFEFWLKKPFRLHERILYKLGTRGWKRRKLFP